MKTKLLFTMLFCIAFTSINAQFSDNMESYVDGQPIYQDHWEDWGCGGSCAITSSSVQAQEGSLSGYVNNSSTDGVLNLGNQTTGEWGLSFWMYVPSGSEGYFNLQGQVPIASGEWLVGNVYFNQDNANPGVGHIDDSALGDVSFSFPHDQWFRIVMNFDLTSGISASTWQFNIDGVDAIPFGTPFTTLGGVYPSALGGIDYFSVTTDTSYWIDTFDYENNFIDPAIQNLTFVPDDNFEQALIDSGYDDVLDNYVLTANINSITYLNVNNENISDLTGIEDFELLQELHCSNNQIISIDISQNTELITFSCNQNQLSVLDVSNNLLLNYLSCAQNNLLQLDVVSNIDLDYLNCYDNSLTILDLSQNINLEYISCAVNQITSLDLSLNAQLTEIYIQDNLLESLNVKNGSNNSITNFIASNNPNLECIEVDDSVSANLNTGVYSSWVIDVNVTYSEDCSAQTFVPDNNFEQELITLGYDRVLNDYVPTANISEVSNLDVSSKNISDLTGIEGFSSLTELQCSDNQISSLDFSQNILLQILRCGGNQLTSLNLNQNTSLSQLYCSNNNLTGLDVSQNTLLELLACYNNQLSNLDVSQNSNLDYLETMNNQLTILDVSQNPLLEQLFCYNNQIINLDVSANNALTRIWAHNNQLISFDVKNGNNALITEFYANDNPSLECIEVDDSVSANMNTGVYSSWVIDGIVTYSEDCSNQTFVPDNNFEQELITLGYDRVLNDYVPTSNISSITNLDVSGKNISDLTGIEDFSLLQIFYASDNQITVIDVTENPILYWIYLENNQLSSIDVSQNPQLNFISIANNQFTTLDISNNSNLYGVSIRGNMFVDIDFTNNVILDQLFLDDNNLTDLDLTQNPLLTGLFAGNNQLTNMDLSQNPLITNVFVYNNELVSLNLKNGNSADMINMNSVNNPNLECIQVDADVVGNIPATWDYDAGVTFSDDCEYLGVNDYELNSISIYPNPTKDNIIVVTENGDAIESLQLYSIMGKQLLITNSAEIDLSNLPVGMYLLQVKTDKGITTKKVIKK